MKQPLFFFLLMVFALLPGYGQDDTPCCREILGDGQTLYRAGYYARAIEKYELARTACNCPGTSTLIAEAQRCQANPNASGCPTARQSYTETVNGVSFTMVAIPGGTFIMGSNDGKSDEKPVHSVTVSSFYAGETEVTQALWRAVIGSDPPEPFFKGCDQCPEERVSWDDAQAFIKKLNSLTGKNYRLPTEAEWEYAAGGGNSSRTKWGGTSSEGSLGSYAWYDGNSGSKIYPVKGKSPNALGLYDMSGNAWEWCQDWYDSNYYKISPSSNPVNSTSASARVLRGGSWVNSSFLCRVAIRYWDLPVNRILSLGFRLALPQD